MIEFFLRRPHFAGVLSFVVLLAGLVTIPTLPIAQYPQISPPTVTVTSQYPGASAAMVMRSVTTPLEININGADGLQYMQSYSSANGTSVITCTFALGTNPTIDQTNVQHGVNLTLAQLPPAVQNYGVSVTKSSGNITIAVAMLSTSSAVADVAVSNYADLNVIEELKRIPGVGQVEVLGDRTYGMRVWVNPHKLQANGSLARHRTQRNPKQQRRRRGGCDRSAADERFAAVSDPDSDQRALAVGAGVQADRHRRSTKRRVPALGRRRRRSTGRTELRHLRTL